MASKRFDLSFTLLLSSILIGALIRLFDFNRWSLFNDELSTIFRAKYESLSQVLSIGVKTDVHPAVNEVFIYSWMSIFGESPFAVRLPYVLMSILGLYIAFLFIRELHNKTTATLTTAVLATTQLFVIYSQVARPYAIGLFILMIFCFFWIKMIKEENWKWVFLSSLFAALGAMTHYFLALTILLVFLSGFSLINRRRDSLVKYLSSGLLSLLFFSPHLKLSLHQFSRKGLGWLPPPEDDFLVEFFFYSLNESFLLILVILISPLIGYLLSHRKLPAASTLSIPFIFLISYAIGHYYSIKVNPVMQFSALIFSFPFLLIFIFSFFQKNTIRTNAFTILVLLVSSGSLLYSADALGPKRFGNFRSVAKNMVDWKKEYGNDLMIFSNSSSPDYLNYYYEQLGAELKEDIDFFNGYESLRDARDLINNNKANYLAIGFANASVPMEVYEIAKIQFPEVIAHHRYFNSDVLLLKRSDRNERRESTFMAEAGEKGWEVNGASMNDSIFYSAPNSYYIGEKEVYSLTFKSKVANVFNTSPDWINVEAKLFSEDTSSIKLVIAIERNGETIDWRAFDTQFYYSKDNWYQFLFVYALPLIAEKEDDLLIYFWNPHQSSTLVDDLRIVNYQDANFDYYKLR